MKLISEYYDKIMINFTAIIPDDGGEHKMNSIAGELHVLTGGNHTTSTDAFGCAGRRLPDEDNVTTTTALWEGYCDLKFGARDVTKIRESDSIQVSIRLQIVCLSQSQELSLNARECNRLRLDAFIRPQFAIGTTNAAKNKEGLETQMQGARRHRVSLEWSISNWTDTLKPKPGGTDLLQFFYLDKGEQPNDWYGL